MTDTSDPRSDDPAKQQPTPFERSRPAQPTSSQTVMRLAASPAAKGILVIFLTICLTIPLFMVGAVVDDRQTYFREATAEIQRSWGGRQTLVGPVLVIPRRQVTGFSTPNTDQSPIVVMPQTVSFDGMIEPRILERGMFQVTAYNSRIAMNGQIDPSDALNAVSDPSALLWDQATLVVGLSDPRSLGDGLSVQVDGREFEPQPGTGVLPNIAASGFEVALPDTTRGDVLAFEIDVAFAGTESVSLLSLARDTQIHLSSPWPDPSFIGGVSPLNREVTDDGFSAEWSLSAFGRLLPMAVSGHRLSRLPHATFQASEAGVRLFQPASIYQQIERSVKYGVLLIVLTFVGMLLIEFAGGVRIHFMQYGLVGLSLCVFYLLYLSLSEHIGLLPAYTVGGLAVIGQIGLYLRSVLGQWRPAITIAALLAGLYAGFYLLLGSADYALLIGSLALFFGLGTVMYATRRVDWSGLSAAPRPTDPSAG